MNVVDMAKLTRCARIPLEPNVRLNDEVLIVADRNSDQAVVDALTVAVREIGAEPSVIVMDLRPTLEPTKAAAGAMKSVDLVINVTSHSLSHSSALRDAVAAGVKYVGMVRATASSITEGAATADPQELLEVTRRVASLLTEASVARVTSALGTDVTVDLRGRKALVLVFSPFPGQAVVPFPGGEAPIAPVEGGTDGVIIFDASLSSVGLLEQPVVLHVKESRITSIEGGQEATKLRELLASKDDENCYMIGEFSFGTNPRARIIGHFEDRLLRGTAHFGFGDNETLGGNIKSRYHIDGIIRQPTVMLDGKVVLENGELKI